MKDKLQDIGKKILKNIDMVAIVLFVLLAATSWYLYSQENQYVVEPLPGQADKPWVEKFDVEPYSVALADTQGQLMDLQPEITEDQDTRRLIQINMFDAASVADQERIEEAVRADFTEAERLASEGSVDRAIDKLNTILQRYPEHLGSRQLLTRLEKEKADAATPEGGN